MAIPEQVDAVPPASCRIAPFRRNPVSEVCQCDDILLTFSLAFAGVTKMPQPSSAHVHLVSRTIHRAQHGKAICFEESPYQQGGEDEKGHVEPARVVPGDGSLDYARVALGRNKTEGSENQLDNQRRHSHRCVERREQKASHLPSV